MSFENFYCTRNHPSTFTELNVPHTASHCTILNRTATWCTTLQRTATRCTALQHAAPHCNTLHHAAPRCTTLHHAAPHCNTLHHTAPCCTTLHHAATHCTTLQLPLHLLHTSLLLPPQHTPGKLRDNQDEDAKVEILKSRLTAQCAKHNDYRADFSEILQRRSEETRRRRWKF